MLRISNIFAAAALSLLALPAHATIIDIDLQTGPSGYPWGDYTPNLGYAAFLSAGGYDFRSTISDAYAFGNWLDINRATNGRVPTSFNANGNNPTLLFRKAGAALKIQRPNFSAFSFSGISLANEYNDAKGGTIDITFENTNGTNNTETITLNNKFGLQSFLFSPNSVKSVTLQGTTNQTKAFQLDFLNVENAVISSVPETSTWMMMMAGFCVIGYSARRNQKQTSRRQVI